MESVTENGEVLISQAWLWDGLDKDDSALNTGVGQDYLLRSLPASFFYDSVVQP